jgi:hypothetical protein
LASAICLLIATTVIITKVVRSDARVCVPIGSGNPAFTASFVAAFDAAGGKTAAGCGYSPVHGWGPGWIQDLRGAKQGNAAIMALAPDYAYVLAGPAWHDYQAQAGSDTGPRAGYPNSAPFHCGDVTMFELADGSAGPGAMLTTSTTHKYIWLTGDVWIRYRDTGGPAGRLGGPSGPPIYNAQGEKQNFEHGWIFDPAGPAPAMTDLESRGGIEPPATATRHCTGLT